MEYGLYTFHSTSQAMQAEIVMKSKNIKARLVPLLTEISAGCGLALRFEKEYKKDVEKIFLIENLSYDQRYMIVYPQGQKKAQVKNYDLL